LGTVPFEGDAATFVKFVFEKGSQYVQYTWGEKGLLGIRLPASPVKAKFLPQTDSDFIGYDLGLVRIMKLKFIFDEKGRPSGLVFQDKTKAMRTCLDSW